MTEPLAASAAAALVHAEQWCGPTGCAWYHRLYTHLRLLDLAPTPERHAAFYLDAFATLADSGTHDRVVVTGSADTGMPTMVLRGYSDAHRVPALTVMDRCATPGRLCEGIGARPVVADLFTWTPGETWDVVTSHAIIGMFPHDRQADLLAQWRRLLRRGGAAVAVQRIQPDWTNPTKGFSATQAGAFAQLVHERAIGRFPEEVVAVLHSDALRFGSMMCSYPLPSTDALVGLLRRAGFRVRSLDEVSFQGNAGAGKSGPGTHRAGTFAHFVAEAV